MGNVQYDLAIMHITQTSRNSLIRKLNKLNRSPVLLIALVSDVRASRAESLKVQSLGDLFEKFRVNAGRG